MTGREKGQTARQIAQPRFSLKYGRHLSKSTYQRRSPRTICLSWTIASGGHASAQTRQLAQKSSPPKTSGRSTRSGTSVRTQASRKFAPSSRWMSEPCLGPRGPGTRTRGASARRPRHPRPARARSAWRRRSTAQESAPAAPRRRARAARRSRADARRARPRRPARRWRSAHRTSAGAGRGASRQAGASRSVTVAAARSPPPR